MCTYAGEKYLLPQLESFARQNRLPDELIICDDNSQDSTMQLIKAFAVAAPFPVKIIKNDANIGSTKNFEQAINLCKGDVIALSDQDDVWHRNKLELIEGYFRSHPEAGVVFSNGNVVNDDLHPLGYTLWDSFGFNKEYRKRFLKGDAFHVLLNRNVVTGATMAFRSENRVKMLPIPLPWVHDSWIALIISIYTKILFIDESLIDYRQHQNQQIGADNNTFSKKLEIARSTKQYHKQILEYELLVDRLSLLDTSNNKPYIDDILNKISHLRRRENIHGCNIISKIFWVLIELCGGRYHRYSKGFLSCIKDIAL